MNVQGTKLNNKLVKYNTKKKKKKNVISIDYIISSYYYSFFFFILGMRLGLLQSKLGIIEILKDYEITPCEKTRIPMVLDPKGLTTTALGGLYLNIRKTTIAGG